jgi:putative ATPase
MSVPLAERLRPTSLDDFIGQGHLVGPKGVLRAAIESGHLPSLILWGPPGTGKTTLAQIIATQSNRPFYQLSAINAGVKDVREVIDKAKKGDGLFTPKNPILFIDEIHRFSKSQQDALLQAVEKGWITLIGATTENPSFEVISALLSRSQVYILEPFNKQDLESLLHRAVATDSILKNKDISLQETAALLQFSGGDARKLLNTLELVCNHSDMEGGQITNTLVQSLIQKNPIQFDKSGEEHYNVISALIKSIRGSDPNAAVYWLARLIEGGEDVKFIARRLIILASEDIGNANPTALILANNTFQAVTTIGFPESRIILSQCVTYLASSPKSNAAYMAISDAQKRVEETGALPVPLSLRNAPTKLMKSLGYGADYPYAHNYEGNFEAHEFMPDDVAGTKFYDPGDNTRENQIRAFLKSLWGSKYKY